MKKIHIHDKIMGALGLSSNEAKVFYAIKSFQLGQTTSKLARIAGVPRSTAVYALNKLEKRGLVMRWRSILHKCPVWRYKKGLEKFKHSGFEKAGN
jgi:predicted transcriptional regulator